MAKPALSKAFQAALARPVLNRLATIPLFQQGQDLFLRQQVTGLISDSEEAAAHVRDGEDLLARLWMEDGFLQYECPCERGKQGFLCAHGVAVALAALEPKSSGKGKAKPKTIDLTQTDKILREQSSETLAGLLLNWARQDERLMQHLMSFAARQGGLAIDLKSYRVSLRKRLKKPRMAATVADYRRYARAVTAELTEIQGLSDQGQSSAALELTADILNLLFAFHSYDGAGADAVLDLIPGAFDLFIRTARQMKAEPKVLIPHLLSLYNHDMDAELPGSKHAGREALLELLGDEGRKELATKAEELSEPKSDQWEDRMVARRMKRLAQDLYLASRDFDAMERAIFQEGNEDFREVVKFGRTLLEADQPRRALDFLARAKATFIRTPPQELHWLLAEAYLDLEDVSGAFEAVTPILQHHRVSDLDHLRLWGYDHRCWLEWREMLLSDDAPAKDRPYWRFLLHMLEENHADAWPILLWHPMEPILACHCAFKMKEKDPVNAARVLTDHVGALLKDEKTVARGLGYLDLAALLVVEHGVRPEGLAPLLRSTHRRFSLYGQEHLARPHEALWNKALSVLTPAQPSLVPGRR
jgi:hypothetical protein